MSLTADSRRGPIHPPDFGVTRFRAGLHALRGACSRQGYEQGSEPDTGPDECQAHGGAPESTNAAGVYDASSVLGEYFELEIAKLDPIALGLESQITFRNFGQGELCS